MNICQAIAMVIVRYLPALFAPKEKDNNNEQKKENKCKCAKHNS